MDTKRCDWPECGRHRGEDNEADFWITLRFLDVFGTFERDACNIEHADLLAKGIRRVQRDRRRDRQ